MATDKLINQTQGDDIIDALNDIADNVGNITYGPQTSADKVVSMLGYAEAAEAASINPGDTLNQAIGKLEKKADDNAAAVAGKIDKLTSATAGDIATVTATGEIADSEIAIETTLSDSSDAKVPTSKAVGTYVDGKGYAVGVNSSTANNLVAFNDANGKALKDSGIAVAKSSTGLTDSDTAVPTSKTVKTYVDSTATGISRYLGTITAASGLSTSAKKGDFYVVKTAWTGVHAGDEIIAEKNGPSQTIDGTNWSLLHNEADTDTKYTFATGDTNGTFKVTPSDTGTAQSVAIKGLAAAAYKGVATSVSTSEDLVTSKAVNTKLASYVPNSDFVELAGLEAEDRASLAEVVDSGAKNLLQLPSGSATLYGITFSCDPNTGIVTANGTKQSGDCFMLLANISLTSFPRKFVAYCNNTENTKLCITIVPHRTNGTYASTIAIGTYTTVDLTSSTFDSFLIRAASYADAGITLSSEKIYPMLCTKAAFSVSPKFVPYAKSNYSLTQSAVQISNTLGSSTDFNNITKTGVYKFTPTPINAPLGCYGILSVYASENYISQIVQSMHHATTAGLFYRYSFDSGATWWPWIGRFVNSYWQTSITTANTWQSVGSVTIDPHTAVKLEAGIEKYSSTSAYPRGVLLSSSTSVSGIAVSNTLCKSEVSADTQTSIYVSATHLNADNTSQTYHVYVKLANADYANIQVIQENLGRK